MNVLAFCAEEQDRNEWVIRKEKNCSFFPCFDALRMDEILQLFSPSESTFTIAVFKCVLQVHAHSLPPFPCSSENRGDGGKKMEKKKEISRLERSDLARSFLLVFAV